MAVGSVMLVVTASTSGCTADRANPLSVDNLQSQLTALGVVFVPEDSGAAADSNSEIVDRASRGSGLSARYATWVWSGELTAQGNQEQNLVDQPVWAVYFSSIEQPMLGPGGGTAISDWLVFVDLNTENVVLATTLTTKVGESTEGQIDGPVFTSPPPPPGEREGMAALVMGTIALDDRGCLVLELEGVRYAIVWPAGTS